MAAGVACLPRVVVWAKMRSHSWALGTCHVCAAASRSSANGLYWPTVAQISCSNSRSTSGEAPGPLVMVISTCEKAPISRATAQASSTETCLVFRLSTECTPTAPRTKKGGEAKL